VASPHTCTASGKFPFAPTWTSIASKTSLIASASVGAGSRADTSCRRAVMPPATDSAIALMISFFDLK
jgi:hypothetical protein